MAPYGTITTRELTPGTRVVLDDVVCTIDHTETLPSGDVLVAFTEPWEGHIDMTVGVAELDEDMWDLA